jgi:hypothetical protein
MGARTQQVSKTDTGNSDPLLLDPNTVGQPPVVQIDIGAGATVTVQVTLDDPASSSAVWVPTPVAALVGATTDIIASLGMHVRGIRLNQSVGATTSVMKVLSPGII